MVRDRKKLTKFIFREYRCHNTPALEDFTLISLKRYLLNIKFLKIICGIMTCWCGVFCPLCMCKRLSLPARSYSWPFDLEVFMVPQRRPKGCGVFRSCPVVFDLLLVWTMWGEWRKFHCTGSRFPKHTRTHPHANLQRCTQKYSLYVLFKEMQIKTTIGNNWFIHSFYFYLLLFVCWT